MIIRSFSIDRFGIFAGQEPVELGPGLNVFLGNNEAGKSTLLNFFRAMFFGYKRDNKNRFDYSASGVSSAQSGGSLVLKSSQGTDFNLIRRPGPHGGILTLTDAEGRALPESFLIGLLSNQTDKIYDQVFCFGHTDLSSLDEMKDERVAGALHAAAFGTGFRSPLEISRTLRVEQDKIFAPRASTRPLNQCLSRLSAVQSQLSHAGSELSQYNSLKSEREKLEVELDELQSRLLALSLEQAGVRGLSSAWADWSALKEIRAELALNPHSGGQFGVDIEHFSEISNALLHYRSERKGKVELLESGQAEQTRGAGYAALAAAWPDCQNLLARKASVQNAVATFPRLEASLQESHRQQEKLAQSLGTGWNLEKALAFEITLALHSGIDRGRQNIEAATRSFEQSGHELARLQKAAREAQAALAALWRGLQADHRADEEPADSSITLALYTPEARLRVESAGRKLEESRKAAEDANASLQELSTAEVAELESLGSCHADLDAAQAVCASASAEAAGQRKRPLFSLSTARHDTRRVPWLLACVLLALLCLSGAYRYFGTTSLQQPDSWAKFTSAVAWKIYLQDNWLTFGLALLFLWGAFYWLNPRIATLGRWRPMEHEYPLSSIERDAQSRWNVLTGHKLAQEMQLERTRSALAVARAGAGLASVAHRQAVEAWNGCALMYSLPVESLPAEALKIFDAAFAAAQCVRQEQEAAEAQTQARDALENAREEWVGWLERNGFAPEFTPHSIIGVLERIRDIQTQAEQAALRATELTEKQAEIQSFRASLAAIMEQTAWETSNNSENGLLATFDALYNAAFGAHQKITNLERQAGELKKLEADLARIDELLGAQEARLHEVLEQGGASGEADYRLRFEQHFRHQKLRREEELLLSRLAQAARQVHAASGEGLWPGFEAFTDALTAGNPEELEQQGLALKQRQDAVQDELSEKHERQGEIRVMLENLASGQGSAALQSAETALKEELKTLARNWGVQALAGSFINQARRSFEEERHDSVIRQGGEILGELTNGRYRQMLFDMGGKDFKAYAVSGSGESLDSESALSQGTREQLYLALRLAFIRQHNLSKESLPVILDDILVNFDPGRARNAASIFTAFSAVNQELFFTCHPNTVELLKDVAPQARLFTIESGKIISGN